MFTSNTIINKNNKNNRKQNKKWNFSDKVNYLSVVYFFFSDFILQVIIQLHGLVALVIKSAISTAYIVLLFSPSGNQFELNMGTTMLQSCSQQTNGFFLRFLLCNYLFC